MKKFLKILGWTVLVLLLVGAYAGYRIVWGHPFTHQPAGEPAGDLLPGPQPGDCSRMIGAVDGTPLDRHSGKLATVGPREARGGLRIRARRRSPRSSEFDRAKLDAAGPDHLRHPARLLRLAGAFHAVRLAVLRGPVPDQPDVRHAGAARELHADHARGEEREDRAQLRRAAAGHGRQARRADRRDAAPVGGGRGAAAGAAREVAGGRSTTRSRRRRRTSPLVTTFVERMAKAQGPRPGEAQARCGTRRSRR